VRGSVYWGSGYSRSGVEGSGNNKFYAFSIDGEQDAGHGHGKHDDFFDQDGRR